MFWKKKKKDTNDYLKNELLRSRMSDISLRTDEILQQYFFVGKDEPLSLDEYLKIRELATRELGMVESTSVIPHEENKNKELPVKVQQEYKEIEEPPTKVSTLSHFPQGNSMSNIQKHSEVEKKTYFIEPAKPTAMDIRKVNDENIESSFEDKRPVEPRPEPSGRENDRDSGFDFLRIMQEIDD